MHFQNMIIAECLATDVTFVWLFASVCSNVDFELLGTSESLLAVFTGVRFFTSVSSHVDDQLARLNKSLTTHLAFMGPFSSMGPHVTMKFARVFKGSSTDVALVGPFLGVDPTMDIKVLFYAECLLAEFTFKWLFSCMHPMMSLQTSGNRKSFPTYLTLIGCFSISHLTNVTLIIIFVTHIAERK